MRVIRYFLFIFNYFYYFSVYFLPVCDVIYTEFYGYFDSKTMICAGMEANLGACSGDSGGPLICSGGLQCGVTSFGNRVCESDGFPTVFAEISNYVDWINQILSDSS